MVDAVVTVVLAFITKSASSFVWGLIAGVAAEVVISFLLVAPKPRLDFSFEKTKLVLGRGIWISLAGFFDYIFNHGDDVVVGRLLNTASLGIYQVGYKISTLPITEVADVFNKVAFPVFVRIADDKDRLRRAYFRSTIAVALVTIPFGIILFLFSESIVLLLLGDGWLAVVPVLKVLSVFGVVRAISGPSSALYLSVKKQEYLTGYTLLSILGLGVTIIPLTSRYGIVGAGISAIVGLFVSLPLMMYYSWKILK